MLPAVGCQVPIYASWCNITKFSRNDTFEEALKGPPLPGPLLLRRRGRTPWPGSWSQYTVKKIEAHSWRFSGCWMLIFGCFLLVVHASDDVAEDCSSGTALSRRPRLANVIASLSTTTGSWEESSGSEHVIAIF